MKIPAFLNRWQFWGKAVITGLLIALVWPKIQAGLTAINASPVIVWGTVGIDLVMMLLWRVPRWQWPALIVWVVAGGTVTLLTMGQQGLLLAIALLFARIVLIALLMGLDEPQE